MYYILEASLTMKTLYPAKIHTEQSKDTEYRLKYIRLIFSNLNKCKKGIKPEELDFTIEEKKVVEYYLKDVAQQTVKEHMSLDQCLEIFKERLQKLVSKNQSEWTRISEITSQLEEFLEPEDIQVAKDMRWFFSRTSR